MIMEYGCATCVVSHVLFIVEDNGRSRSKRKCFARGLVVSKCERNMTPVCSDAEHDGDLLFNASSGFLKRGCHMWDEWANGYE